MGIKQLGEQLTVSDLFDGVHIGLKLSLFFPLYVGHIAKAIRLQKSLQVVGNSSIFLAICTR